MPISPSGPLSMPLENLRAMLAHCAQWRSWIGISSVTEAKTRIYLVDIPPAPNGGNYTVDDLERMRPLARIDLWEPPMGYGQQPWKATAVADRAFMLSGKLVLDLVADVPEEDFDNANDAKLRFMNSAGAVMLELMGLSCAGDYLDSDEIEAGIEGMTLRQLELYQGPTRTDETQAQTQGDCFRAQIMVQWGV